MSIESEAEGRLKGKIIFEAKADDQGNMLVLAPNTPVDVVCKILASMLIDLLLQSSKQSSNIIKPSTDLSHFLKG